jgi:hypothetical protein
MNIDERLEKLAERHEVLAQNVELLLLDTQKHDKQIGDLASIVKDVAEGTARLLHVVELHEHRLDSHSDRMDKLEE